MQMKIQNIKTKEKFEIISHSWVGLFVGGSYTICNLKTKEISTISGNKLEKKYKVL